ncbi:hypothetical protein NCCP2140_04060 [Pseudoalteromonas sp. NCCP-2140]|uniref:hypothetical protein n=1 Tax=Pseudoalteromonas TaxID=53246 RepID=UPI001EFDDE8A|nr:MULTISPECIES: hypothetical protein [Pseudoalteromonas]MCG9735754.1 hypothetical protein [Pseudoalteromonas shioyasakiensis]GKW51353.1 hypothetical protein NCCP2140_04060 [Pseudoalteromonas sp. NCCP-2140]
MKYKNFKPLIHNFTHSFVGGCNYVDGKFIYEDLFELAQQKSGEKVIIQWIPRIEASNPELTKRVKESISFYQQWLPKLANSLGVSLDHLVEYQTEIYLTKTRQINIRAFGQDDRGKKYEYFVWI